MRAKLIPNDGGQPVDISRDITVVGRKRECDLRLRHKSVSKYHCVLVKTDGLLLLRDLGSTNGTRVNGQRVRRAALLPNDRVQIAAFGFRVFLGPSEPPSTPQEGTEYMDKQELTPGPRKKRPTGGNGSLPVTPAKLNPLPDVYPEQKEEDE